VNIVEYMRENAVERLFDMKTFDASFEVWGKEINQQVGEEPDFHDLLEVGDVLRPIFKATGKEGRNQSSVSGGGAAWEGLVCWYLNLCLVGTRTVVIKHNKKLIPKPVADAITVMYGSFVSNTESDLIAITFPETNDLSKDIEDFEDFDYNDFVDELCKENFSDLEVGVIQCKTNWNDNAQIPMLWEMVYSSEGFKGDITIGRNGFTKKDLRNFFYAFVTVPSNKITYKPNSVKVKRVEKISGGNYWGKPTKNGVAQSLKEIFNGNFDYGWMPDSQRECVNSALKSGADLSYFKLDSLNPIDEDSEDAKTQLQEAK